MVPADGSSSTPGTGPQNGWWKDFLEIVPEGYSDLLSAEEDALRITHFHPTLVPGLLQTEAYATAITPTT
ncbi:MAG TPA: Scr1 family TA system antitoxin-like transcriptional regulator, partial [Chloroflexota bacterium]|nr:Scr1 family TA system antitoxin-like transcriptional regulator [Chloroflexota bacterium]